MGSEGILSETAGESYSKPYLDFNLISLRFCVFSGKWILDEGIFKPFNVLIKLYRGAFNGARARHRVGHPGKVA